MYITCLDVEGVLVPEIWIAFAEASGIPELKRTTRDEPDYDKLMKWRLGILKEHGLGLKEIQETIEKIDPMPGARVFLDELRELGQVIIISDTFTQFAKPLMKKLGWPTIFCNELEVAEDGEITGFKMRIEQSKLSTVKALQSIGFETIASGDSLYLDGTFQEGKPEIVRNRLPVKYDPKATQPTHWLRFLSDLLYPEDIPTVQEFIGYCLIPSNKGQRMMVIKGSGGEGKSQIGVVLSRLFGCNMKDGSIGKISENRFARADLEHTLLCVDDDMRMEALRQTNYVKSIVTAQGQMDLERKGKQSYQGWMYARLLAFSNGDLQALYDRSDGFYRRQLILTTREKPQSRVDDPDIAEKMAAEVEGILLWAFEGLQRLVKNGFQFTESNRAKRNRELVKRDNNNVFDFLESEGYIRLKADACTSSKELYEVYKMWCEENSLNAIKSRGFSDALIANQRRYNLESTNNIVNSSGRRVRGFVGIEALVQPDLTPNGWRA